MAGLASDRSCKHRRGDCSSPSAPEVVACRMTDTIGPVANRHSCVRLADCVLARAVCQTLRAQNSSYPYPACTSTAPFQPSREDRLPAVSRRQTTLSFRAWELFYFGENQRGVGYCEVRHSRQNSMLKQSSLGKKIVRQLLRFASLGHRVSTRALVWVKTHSAETTSSGTCSAVGHV